MADEEIRALKAALDVSTDIELARVLGVERSSIAQWKRRGAVPKKYRAFLGHDGMVSELTKLLSSGRRRLGQAEYHYWIRAALAFMAPEFPDPSEAYADRGRRREAKLLMLVKLAMVATNLHLGKQRCESEEDYEALIAAMVAHELAVIVSIAEDDEESPQSESSIDGASQKVE